jgi:hypothetical protein
MKLTDWSMKTTMSNLSKDLNKKNKKIKEAAKVQSETLAIDKKKADKAARFYLPS